MKTTGAIATIVLLAIAVSPSLSAAEPPDPAATAGELAGAHARRFAAMIAGDLDALGEMLADELTYAHSNGRVQTKAEFLATLRGGSLRYLAITPEGDDAVRLYGDGTVGIVTGTARFRVHFGGKDGEPTLRYTSVYVHRDGRWQLVAWHSSTVGDT